MTVVRSTANSVLIFNNTIDVSAPIRIKIQLHVSKDFAFDQFLAGTGRNPYLWLEQNTVWDSSAKTLFDSRMAATHRIEVMHTDTAQAQYSWTIPMPALSFDSYVTC